MLSIWSNLALFQVKRKEPLDDMTVLSWLYQLASGLQYAHERGVLHRDLKPGNIFLSKNGRELRIGDFGLSKVVERGEMCSSRVGTIMYMAPEVRNKSSYTSSADLYSLGVLAYELASLKDMRYDEPSRLALSDISYRPPALVSLISSMLQTDPTARPSAGAVASRVRALQQQLRASRDGMAVAGLGAGGQGSFETDLDVGSAASLSPLVSPRAKSTTMLSPGGSKSAPTSPAIDAIGETCEITQFGLCVRSGGNWNPGMHSP